ncbi:MAG: hypothetical protein GF350_05630 [Chitinivibrionales bacterium]|nr:hypothetical protein [Chitinivibrionales bacterium]
MLFKRFLPTFAVIGTLAAFLACDTGTNPEEDSYPLVCPEDKGTAEVFSVIEPSGGKIYHPGDQCTVLVRAEERTQIVLQLYTHAGLNITKVSQEGFVAPEESVYVFSIPDTIYDYSWNDSKGAFDTIATATISDSCLVAAYDYGDPRIIDFSDCFFAIRP